MLNVRPHAHHSVSSLLLLLALCIRACNAAEPEAQFNTVIYPALKGAGAPNGSYSRPLSSGAVRCDASGKITEL